MKTICTKYTMLHMREVDINTIVQLLPSNILDNTSSDIITYVELFVVFVVLLTVVNVNCL